ncbi:MAG: hypothetical protein IIZ83_08850 [Oscillospiraceae bacterium]|nr:hypothetical protein [Oscillospiraceae bacterium]
MSVYIKGFPLPNNCGACPLRLAWCRERIYMVTRPERCPLVPVPPHGALKDADALRQSIKESIDECHAWAEEVNEGEMYARVSQALGTFVECSLRIKAAPTIIPAEEET